MSIERQFKKWLQEKPMAKILVTENSQMGYILEFAKYHHEQEKIKSACLDIMKTSALDWGKKLNDEEVIDEIIKYIIEAGSNSDLQTVRYWLYSYLEYVYPRSKYK